MKLNKNEISIDKKTLEKFLLVQKETKKEAKELFKKKNKIKVLGISSSARDEFDMAGQNSNSEFLLKKALEFFSGKKIENEIIELRKYDIKPCKACYSTTNCQCHFPCSCYPKGSKQGDDMSSFLYDKILEADIIIFATPVNNFKMSSLLSLFIDRMIALDGSLSPADESARKDVSLNKKHSEFVKSFANREDIGSGFLKRLTGKVAGIIVTGHEEGASMVISSLFMTLNHFGMVFPPFSSVYALANVENSIHEDSKLIRSDFYISEVQDLSQNLLEMAKILQTKEKSIWTIDNSIN